MKVAFATEDLATVNAHFGWAKHIVVYDISPDGYTHAETYNFAGDPSADSGQALRPGSGQAHSAEPVVSLPNHSGQVLQEDGSEDKLLPKLEAIADCAILYVAAIGGSGAARVVAKKVHPVKVQEPEPITEILEKLQAVLGGTPPPWLRKAMQKGQARELDFAEE